VESSNFDQIAQQIIQQKHHMDKLEEENRELRRQISDLITGRELFVEIEGRRFRLAVPNNAATPGAPEAQDKTQPSNQQESKIGSVGRQSTPSEQEEKGKKTAHPAPSFLEEALLDEFALAMTSPVQSVQPQGKQKEAEDPQKQKERLRRELMGSYILE
jgi:hypothetical protein